MSSDPWANIPNYSSGTAAETERDRSAGDPSRFFPSVRAGKVDAVTGRILNVPRACIYQGSSQNVPVGVLTAVTLDVKLYDSDGMWNPLVPSRLTARTSGEYTCHANLGWAANTTSYREVMFRVNGGPAYAHSIVDPSQVTVTEQSCHWPIQMKAGDYIELLCSHNVTAVGTWATLAGLSETALAITLTSTFGSDQQ